MRPGRSVVALALLLSVAAASSCGGNDPLFVTSDEDGEVLCVIEGPTRMFAGTIVGDSSQLTLIYRNLGQGVLSGVIALSDSGSAPADGVFTLTQGGGRVVLGPGRSRVVAVTFKPTAAGTREVTLTAPGACRATVLQATALDPPSCTVSADSLDAGMVELGFAGTATVTVANQTSVLSGTVTLTQPCPNFSVTSGAGPFSLAAGESLQVDVSFAPSAVADFSCQLDFGTPFCPPVTVVGTGFGVAACSTNVTSIDLGDVLADDAGGQSATGSFTVYNVGSLPLDVNPFLTGGDADFSITNAGARQIAVGDSTTYSVRFDPVFSLAGYGDQFEAVGGLGGCNVQLQGEGLVGFNTHISAFYNVSQSGFSACVNCHGGGGIGCGTGDGAATLSFNNVSALSNTGSPSNSAGHTGVANTFQSPGGTAYRTVLIWIIQAAARGGVFNSQ
jgi:hypothetical protein